MNPRIRIPSSLFLIVSFMFSQSLLAYEAHKTPEPGKTTDELPAGMEVSESAELNERINNLMRRLDQLKDEKKALEDKVQNIERRIDESKRHHD